MYADTFTSAPRPLPAHVPAVQAATLNPLRGRHAELASLKGHLSRLRNGAGTSWLDERLVDIRAGHATLVEARLPLRVRDSMRRRLGRMSAPARRVAAVAASMGRLRHAFGKLAINSRVTLTRIVSEHAEPA
jgi:hypothetical protein